MRTHLKFILPIVALVTGVLVFILYLVSRDAALLNPQGLIASQQYDLLIFATLLMMLIVIPVFALTFFIAWKYRAENTEAKYRPEWDHNLKLELLWWGLPCVIIFILAVTAWTSSHALDPTREISSDKRPVTIQVIALEWKWLFIYPKEQIASVNYVQFPADTPVRFEITADAPMNSFWIPQLGGQIYAMAGMTTSLHLMADKPGTYRGVSSNLSGRGFADMSFSAEATTDQEYDNWVSATKLSGNNLSMAAYNDLALPNVAKASTGYASYEPGLYDTVIMKYMSSEAGHAKSSESHKSDSTHEENHE